ncbi:MAG: STAS domain-containing protein [Gammaproteobacteria bacterium]|nr:MAG: STAS domain-containing protein [Gammaproteobacteria bacterium]
MKVPILKQGNVLIATVQSVLSDQDFLTLQQDLSQQVNKYRAHGVVIDITELDVMDSFSTRTLRNIANILKLRGAETIIVGMQPDVAFAMVQLGLTLPNVKTARDLEEGLALLHGTH